MILSKWLYNSNVNLSWAVKEDSKVHLGLFKRFTLQELQVATDNFRETNIVDVNAFGKVYRGKLADNSLVAVKRLYEDRSYGQEEFQAVGDLINYICFHRNILRVIGFCMTSKERIFVYPFMANGNLKTCLRGTSHSSALCTYEMMHVTILLISQFLYTLQHPSIYLIGQPGCRLH